MKKRLFSVALLFFLGCVSYAGNNFRVAAMASYFQPSERTFKSIYGGGVAFGGEVSLRLWKWMRIWANGDAYNKQGQTTLTAEKTRINIIPLGLGLMFELGDSRIRPSAGFGFGYFRYRETNPIGKVEKGEFGYIARLACDIKISGPFFFAVRSSYSFCKVNPAGVEANLGGLKGGVGLGWEF
jgi:hypothetical protein